MHAAALALYHGTRSWKIGHTSAGEPLNPEFALFGERTGKKYHQRCEGDVPLFRSFLKIMALRTLHKC